MKKIKVTCECCNIEHYMTRAEVGRAFLKLRKTSNTTEHQRKAGALGAEKRWNYGKTTKGLQSKGAQDTRRAPKGKK